MVKNIFCVGRNYRLHAEELGNKVPTTPFLFCKPTHALVKANGQEILLPDHRGEVHHEVELVVHIGNSLHKGKTIYKMIDYFTLGIDFTLREEQSKLKEEGKPWLLAKGFPNSAVVGAPLPFTSEKELMQEDFSLVKNGEIVQKGNIQNMIFDLQTLLKFTKEHFGIGEGDLMYTGTPKGVGQVKTGDYLEMFWGKTKVGSVTIRMGNEETG